MTKPDIHALTGIFLGAVGWTGQMRRRIEPGVAAVAAALSNETYMNPQGAPLVSPPCGLCGDTGYARARDGQRTPCPNGCETSSEPPLCVDVIQADRAQAAAYQEWAGDDIPHPANILSGREDDHPLVQSYARHRSSAALDRISAGEVELIRRIVLPIVHERSREPGDAWSQAHDTLVNLLSAHTTIAGNTKYTGREAGPCPDCDDTGYVDRKDMTQFAGTCDCACGRDVRRERAAIAGAADQPQTP